MPLDDSEPKEGAFRTGVGLFGIVLIVAVVFSPGLSNGYVGWDDHDYIRDNPHLTAPDGLRRIWTTLESPQYYPLTFTSYWLEHRLWGDSPTGYYVTNVALHAACALLVLALARCLGMSPWAAWLVAALFAVHPIQVASVAWLAERKNVLSGMFALATFVMYLRHRRGGRFAPYVASLVLFACALLSKTAVMTLPLSLWAADWLVLRRRGWGGVWRLLPMLALAAGAATVTLFVEHAEPMAALEPALRPFAAAAALCFYLGKIAAPLHLPALYPQWSISPASVWWWLLILGAFALGAAAWHWRRRLDGITQWSACHFVVMIAPVLGLIPFGYLTFAPVADHFLYLAILGPLIALTNWLAPCNVAAGLRAGRLALLSMLTLLAVLGVKTWHQVQIWHDPIRLWSHTLKYNPNCPAAHNNLGLYLEKRGDLDEAFAHYATAVRIDPNYAQAQSNLGAAFNNRGDLDRAMLHCAQAVKLQPTLAEAHSNLGSVLAKLGRYPQAAGHFARAVELKPGLAEAHANWGAALFELGHIEEAIVHYRAALRLDPDSAAANLNLANALARQGDFDRATTHYRRSLELAPDSPAARANFGLALLQQGRTDQAVAEFQAAVQLNPHDAQLHVWCGNVLAQHGAADHAIVYYRAALTITPGWNEAQIRLAWTLATWEHASPAQSAEAVLLAEEVCSRTQRRHAPSLDTLAAAYAACGRFEEAVNIAEQAHVVAQSAGDTKLAAEIAARLTLYRVGQPYRRLPPAKGP